MLSRVEIFGGIRSMGLAALIVILTLIHALISVEISEYFFGLFGGAHHLPDGWTSFGGIPTAWTSLAWLPGSAVMLLSPALGLLLNLLSSFIAAASLSLFIVGFWAGKSKRQWWSRWYAPFALWLIWLPVPAQLSMAYWTMVRY
jgi:hypothetical protein